MWDPEGSTSNLEIINQETTATQSLNHIGCSIGLPATPTRTPTENKWYYEVKVDRIRGAIFIGIVSKKSSFTSNSVKGGKGVGDFPGTWAIDSISGSIGNAGKWKSYAHKFKPGNIIGVRIDLSGEMGILSFTINNEEFGPAFTNLDPNDRYFPAIVLKYRLTQATGMFDKFRFCPPSYLPITHQPVESMDRESAAAYKTEIWNQQNIPLLHLPEEVIMRIMSKMTTFDLGRAAVVCRHLQRISLTSSLWKRLLKTEFGWRYSKISSPNLDDNASHDAIDFRTKCRVRSNWFSSNFQQKVEFFPSKVPQALGFTDSLLAVAEDDSIALYNLDRSDPEYGYSTSLYKDGDTINCMQMEDNIIVSGACDVHVWDADTALLKHSFINNLETTCLQFQRDILLTGSRDLSIKTLDMTQGKQIWEQLEAHDRPITSVQFWDNVAFSSAYDEIKMWDLRMKKEVWTNDDATGIQSLCYCPTMGTLFSGGDDKQIRLYDIRQRIGMESLRCQSGIRSMKLKNEMLVSAHKQSLSIWRIRSFLEMQQQINTKGYVNCFDFNETDLRVGGELKVMHWDYRGDVKFDYKFKRKITQPLFNKLRSRSLSE
eukprot:TRINITY_DN15578_c0_g1_i1.p1 TRINITY_DN15578_c0_g1~~TRINITY_DN15578_c0_g1_i1.p1  ORF type:complete len:617 (-),score=131.12 TRINITY_DN15578_c0_g1_i1:79-1875(-)